MARKVLAVVLFSSFVAPAHAAAPGLEGTWAGSLKVGPSELRVVFHINEKGNAFTGTMDSPDQGAYGVPCDRIVVKDRGLGIEMNKLGAAFVGALSDDAKEIAGVWHQGGQQVPLTLQRSKLTPQLIPLAFWSALVLMSAFFLRLACGLCRTDLPSWPRAIISTLVVASLAYLTFDYTAYLIMRSMEDVLIQVPPWYSFNAWFREPLALKWAIISHASFLRFLPIIFAVCAAGVLQVIVLQAQVSFHFGLVIALLQWSVTILAAYIVSLLLGPTLSAAGWTPQLGPVVHAVPDDVQRPQEPGKSTPDGKNAGAGKATVEEQKDSQATSLQVFDKDATQYLQHAGTNLKNYANSQLEEVKQQAAPVTRHLPEPVQRFLDNGGWWAILGILAFFALLWLRSLARKMRRALSPRRRKKKRRAKSVRVNLQEDLSELGEGYTEEGPQQITVKGVPARLRLVILSNGARNAGELSEEMVDRVLDWIKPGLAEVCANDYPRVRLWPPAYSFDGFATALANSVKIPQPKGDKSRWVVVAGQVRIGKAIINVGLGLYGNQATTMRNIKLKGSDWLGVLGVRDTRETARAR